MPLSGQVALITGGASGLGKQVADALHSQGVTLIIADINKTSGVAAAEAFNQLREGSAFFFQVDVTKWEDQVQVFKAALDHVKRIDYVFANAGIMESTYLPYTSHEKIEWIKPDISTIDVNTIGVLYTCHLAAQVFRTQPIVDGFRGKIIVTASAVSFTAVAYMPLYSTSKHSLVGLVRSLAGQLADESITVNAVAPNITRSSIAPAALFDNAQDQGYLTPSDKVTEAFLSFLGGSIETGLIKEVSMGDIVARQPLEHINSAILPVEKLLAEVHKAIYAAPATSPL